MLTKIASDCAGCRLRQGVSDGQTLGPATVKALQAANTVVGLTSGTSRRLRRWRSAVIVDRRERERERERDDPSWQLPRGLGLHHTSTLHGTVKRACVMESSRQLPRLLHAVFFQHVSPWLCSASKVLSEAGSRFSLIQSRRSCIASALSLVLATCKDQRQG